MFDYLQQSAQLAWSLAQLVFVIYALGLALEQWMGRAEDRQPLSDVAFNIQYTLVYLLVGALLLPGFQRVGDYLRDGVGGSLIHVDLSGYAAGQVLGMVLYIFIFDFFYYWWHRLQHASVMWPQHAFHHADRSVNITTGIRHHWLEEPLRVFFIWLPMHLLFDLSTVHLADLWLLLSLWGYFTHLNIRLRMGWLTPVIAGPQFHRVHHSVEPRHINHNFAAYLPIYDLIFGTYYSPARDEFPRTGLDGEERVALNRLGSASVAPFVGWYRLIMACFDRRVRRTKRG